jgi:uncharacterized YccA/Bax inhibitor family protein
MGFAVSSPAMKPELFQGRGSYGRAAAADQNVMTVSGTVNATGILLALCVASATGTWILIQSQPGLAFAGLIASLLVGLVCSLIMLFKPSASPVIAPIYGVSEGVFVGAISWVYALQAAHTKLGGATGANIIAAAAIGTFSVLGVMLALYKFNIIRATARLKAVMLVCGLAIGLFYLVTLVMRLAGVMPSFLLSGPIAIAITAAILLYASYCLILDFDYIEEGAATGAPKYMEWYAGFALLMTLIWIYLQILRLLSLLNKRN